MELRELQKHRKSFALLLPKQALYQWISTVTFHVFFSAVLTVLFIWAEHLQ